MTETRLFIVLRVTLHLHLHQGPQLSLSLSFSLGSVQSGRYQWATRRTQCHCAGSYHPLSVQLVRSSVCAFPVGRAAHPPSGQYQLLASVLAAGRPLTCRSGADLNNCYSPPFGIYLNGRASSTMNHSSRHHRVAQAGCRAAHVGRFGQPIAVTMRTTLHRYRPSRRRQSRNLPRGPLSTGCLCPLLDAVCGYVREAIDLPSLWVFCLPFLSSARLLSLQTRVSSIGKYESHGISHRGHGYLACRHVPPHSVGTNGPDVSSNNLTTARQPSALRPRPSPVSSARALDVCMRLHTRAPLPASRRGTGKRALAIVVVHNKGGVGPCTRPPRGGFRFSPKRDLKT